jgi:hypothetical protein
MTTETAVGSLEERVAEAFKQAYSDKYWHSTNTLVAELAARNLKIVEMKNGE